MKKVALLLMLELILGFGAPTPGTAQNIPGQQLQQPSGSVAPPNIKDWERGHREYFPGTVYNDAPEQPGIAGRFHNHVTRRMSDFTNHFNPCNEDYGDQLAQWRRQVVDETVRNIIFWLAVGELILLAILTLYLMYLLRQREQRLWISADIACQLHNSWAVAHNKSKAVIAEHNSWMQQINDAYDASLRDGEEEERPRLDPIEPVEQPPRAPKYLNDKPPVEAPPQAPAPLQVSDNEPELSLEPAILSVRAAKFDDGGRGRSTPRQPESAADKVTVPDTDDLLKQLNGSAADQAQAANVARDLEREKAKAKALEQQNTALKQMLNKTRSDAAASADPIKTGDAE